MLSDNAYHHHDAQQRQPAGFHTGPLEKVTLGIKILKTHSHSQIADNPIPIPEFWNVEFGIVLLRTSHSNHAKVLWNVEYGMWNSTFQFLFQNFGMWNVELCF